MRWAELPSTEWLINNYGFRSSLDEIYLMAINASYTGCNKSNRLKCTINV